MEILNYEGLQLYHELASEKFANITEVQAALTNLNDKKVDKNGNKVLSTNDYTNTEKNKLASIAYGAEVNQNAFSNITNGTTTITADSATDTLTLEAGSNITLNLDSTNDKITISAATYDAAGSNLGLVKSGGDVTISSGTITVKDDSHNHIIDNIDDLRNILDAKINAEELTITTSGTGNAITSAFYNSGTKTITLKKDASYNNYTLPAAGSTLGGVKSGGDVTISSGVITVNDDSHNHIISNIDGLQDYLDSKADKSDYETFKTNVNTLLDSDDETLDQMSEIVAYTKSNKDLIDSITTSKQDKITGAATTITSSNLTTSRALISNSSGKVAISNITTSELNQLDGIDTSKTIQVQLDEKASTSVATTTANGLMSSSDKSKLNSIAQNANNYSLPTAGSTLGGVKTTSTVTNSSGYTPVPIINGIPYYKDTNTTYDVATTAADGLMSATDKAQLDSALDKLSGIANNANNYSLPTASSSTKGGVRTGAAISDTTGYTAVHIKDGVIYYKDTNTNLVTSVFGRTGAVTLSKNDVTTALGYTPPSSDTTYSAGTGLSLSGTTFSTKLNSTTSLGTIGTTNKLYAVGVDANGKLCVSVPWTDSTPVTSVFGRTGAVTLTKSDVTTALGYTPPTTDTDTHYTTGLRAGASGTATNATTTDPYLKVTDNNTYSDQVQFKGAGATTVSSNANGVITISSTDTQAVSSVNSKTGAVSLSYSDVSAAPTSHASSSTTYGISSSSNYGHAKASSTTPKANGTASAGTETSSFARGDHVHPSQTTISGNAGSATTLQNTRYIDGVSFTGSANVTRYATCSTSASTVAKTASITAGTFNLITGARVTVKFSNANTATNPTLNIGSTGAKAIYWHGSNIPNTQFWEAGATLDFVYNGTQYELIGVAKDNDSAYSVYNSKITLSPGTGLSGGGDFTINQSSAETITFNLANTSVTSGSYGPSSNASPQAGGTFSVPYITVDAQGRLTAASTKTITLPSDSDTHHSAYLYLGGAGASSNATSAVSDPYLNLRENNTNRSSIQIKGGTNISISGSNGIITINSTATSSDTKVNMTSNSTTKAYLLGTTTTPSSSTQAVTSIADSGVYLGTSSGELVATQFTGYLNGTANLAATANKLGTSSKGSSLQPIYLNAGSPEAVSYVGVNYGGTGATTKSGARENLGINSGTSLPSSGTSGDIFFLYS